MSFLRALAIYLALLIVSLPPKVLPLIRLAPFRSFCRQPPSFSADFRRLTPRLFLAYAPAFSTPDAAVFVRCYLSFSPDLRPPPVAGASRRLRRHFRRPDAAFTLTLPPATLPIAPRLRWAQKNTPFHSFFIAFLRYLAFTARIFAIRYLRRHFSSFFLSLRRLFSSSIPYDATTIDISPIIIAAGIAISRHHARCSMHYGMAPSSLFMPFSLFSSINISRGG